jgi:hypothetical protein
MDGCDIGWLRTGGSHVPAARISVQRPTEPAVHYAGLRCKAIRGVGSPL